ncbi:unnamed protein product [Caenorhabditis brenneri]
MITKPPKKLSNEPSEQQKRRSREEERAEPCYLSNDGFLWTETNPDVKLIEPRILVSLNYNYLEFPLKDSRPPVQRAICLINHGDHPIAFKVETTDNWSYFVDRKNGIIPPRQTCVNAAIRMPNTVEIQIYHRPHLEYDAEDRGQFFSRPSKDKLSVLLAPQMCQTFSPEAIFHNERCYEKLRVMLRFSGMKEVEGDKRPKQLLLHAVPGWATWKEDDGARKKKNEKQMEEFRRNEKTIIQASKEVCEEQQQQLQKVAPFKRLSASPGNNRGTPVFFARRRPSTMMKQFRNRSPFDKTPTTKTTQSVTPEKKKTTSDEDAVPHVLPPVINPAIRTGNIKVPAMKRTSLETPKKIVVEPPPPSPGSRTPPRKSMEHAIEKSKRKSREKEKSKEKEKSHEKSKESDGLPAKTPTPAKDVISPKALSNENMDKKLTEAQSLQPRTAVPKKGSGEHDSKSPKHNIPQHQDVPSPK